MWRGAVVALLALGCTQPSTTPAPSPGEPVPRNAAGSVATVAVEVPPVASALAAVEVEGGEVVLEVTVDDAIVAVDELVVLEPGSLVVSAHALADGRRQWSRPFQQAAVGAHLLLRLEQGRILVRGGEGLTVIDPGGAIVAQHALAMGDRLYLWERDGACGLRGACSMQLVDCAGAKPLGPAIQGQIRHRRSFDGEEMHSGCWAFDLDLVGRSGEVVVYFVHNAQGSGADTAFGIHAGDGRVLWRSAALGCAHCAETKYGMSPDGQHCWTYHDDQLIDFACKTGTKRWSRRAGEPRMTLWAGDAGGGIFVSSGSAAVLHDPRDGTPRWTRRVGTEVVALPAQGKLTPSADVLLAGVEASRLVLLDVASGTPVKHGGAPRGTVTAGPDGALGLGPFSPARDHTGQLIPTTSPPTLTIERGQRPGSSVGPPDRARISAGGTLIEELPHDAWLLGEVRQGDAVFAAVMVARTPRQVRVYRLALADR